MVSTVIEAPAQSFHWLDIVDPTKQELEHVAQKYGLHPTSVQDCLDPEHLPKFERIGGITFIITRAFDDRCTHEADTVQELTGKIAVFIGDGFLITVHRRDQPFMAMIREKYSNPASHVVKGSLFTHILSDVLRHILLSFERPIDLAILKLEEVETRIFRWDRSPQIIEEAYFLKRRTSVIKRILRLSLDILPRLSSYNDQNAPVFQDIRENVEMMYFYADELLENINNVLNLHVSLESQRLNAASHQTNEVMRVLTVFSVFFMPLNFIVGIYGMNFEHMPELKFEHAYPLVWVVMVSVSIGIFLWFRRKGWLK